MDEQKRSRLEELQAKDESQLTDEERSELETLRSASEGNQPNEGTETNPDGSQNVGGGIRRGAAPEENEEK